MPRPSAGQVLFRNMLLSLDAGTRMWMTPRTDGYQPPIPIGATMPGLALGRVIESRHERFKEGDLVRAFGQWADYSCVDPLLTGMVVLDESANDVRQHFGVLGMNAWTAYVGVTEILHAKAGETVVVSAAAGATGMLAAQVAKILGCEVVGIAGGEVKCAFLRDVLSLHGAIDYKREDVAARLSALPEGVHGYFDNVGGPLLDAVLPNMALYGRVAIYGLLSTYESDRPAPGPSRFDQVLMRRLQITGFFSPDFADRGDDINHVMGGWLREGRIQMRFDETDGLENVLSAYGKLFSGGNLGKVIVRV